MHLEVLSGWPALLLQEAQPLKGEASYAVDLHLNAPEKFLPTWSRCPCRMSGNLHTCGLQTEVGVSGFGYGGTNSHAMAFGKNAAKRQACSTPPLLPP